MFDGMSPLSLSLFYKEYCGLDGWLVCVMLIMAVCRLHLPSERHGTSRLCCGLPLLCRYSASVARCTFWLRRGCCVVLSGGSLLTHYSNRVLDI